MLKANVCMDCSENGGRDSGEGICPICGIQGWLYYGELDLENILAFCEAELDSQFFAVLGQAYQRAELKRLREEIARHRGRARNARKLLHDCIPVPVEELREMFPDEAGS